jgi:hypothetical protein
MSMTPSPTRHSRRYTMHMGRRRISLILGVTAMALMLTFPMGVAARTRTVPADVLGTHTWAGELCDGTAATVTYHVTSRGRVVFDSATGADARVWRFQNFFMVRFRGTTHARVLFWVTWPKGVATLHSRAWAGHCAPVTPPAGDPPPVDDGGNGQTG